MTSILSVIMRICRNEFKCNCLRDKKTFSQFLAPFLKSTSDFKQFKIITTLIAYLFPKLQTPKDLVRTMSKTPRYRTSFDSPFINSSQAFMNSV